MQAAFEAGRRRRRSALGHAVEEIVGAHDERP
jgi:hypothetical protein